jgi:hypothetical protein
MKKLISLAFCLSLALPGCTPDGAVRNDPLAGPYRVLSVKEIFAGAPQYKPGDDLKAFIAKRLDWAFAPGHPSLTTMDPEADLWLSKAVTPEQVLAAETALAAEGHKGARLIVALNGGANNDAVKQLVAEGYEPAEIFEGGFEASMGDTPEARATRDKLRKLAARYPMAKLIVGLSLVDEASTDAKLEGIKLLSEIHDVDALMLQTVVTSLYFMEPHQPQADKVARQMLEAYVAAMPEMVKSGEPIMHRATLALGTLLQEGRGGPKDPDRAAGIFTTLVATSHASCEPEAAAALMQMNKPVPEGKGAPCTAETPPPQQLQ